MNTPFESRTLVNGGMLKQFTGQSVSIMVRVESVAGSTLLAMSTDNQKLRINLPSELSATQGSWVEVIGIPSAGDTIRAKEVNIIVCLLEIYTCSLIFQWIRRLSNLVAKI